MYPILLDGLYCARAEQALPRDAIARAERVLKLTILLGEPLELAEAQLFDSSLFFTLAHDDRFREALKHAPVRFNFRKEHGETITACLARLLQNEKWLPVTITGEERAEAAEYLSSSRREQGGQTHELHELLEGARQLSALVSDIVRKEPKRWLPGMNAGNFAESMNRIIRWLETRTPDTLPIDVPIQNGRAVLQRVRAALSTGSIGYSGQWRRELASHIDADDPGLPVAHLAISTTYSTVVARAIGADSIWSLDCQVGDYGEDHQYLLDYHDAVCRPSPGGAPLVISRLKDQSPHLRTLDNISWAEIAEVTKPGGEYGKIVDARKRSLEQSRSPLGFDASQLEWLETKLKCALNERDREGVIRKCQALMKPVELVADALDVQEWVTVLGAPALGRTLHKAASPVLGAIVAGKVRSLRRTLDDSTG